LNLAPQKLAFIDALRGYAILGVVLVHSSQHIAAASPALQKLMSLGAYGVELFYIASALTLSLSWEYRHAKETFPIRNFFVRRFFRIAPMFYIAIIFYVFLYGLSSRYWAPNGVQWWCIPLTALFLHGFNPETMNSVVPGGWSIAVEMNFYLMLPLILYYLTTSKSRVIFLFLSLVLYVISKFSIPYLLLPYYPINQQHLVYEFSRMNIFGQLPIFALGLLTHSAIKEQKKLKQLISYGTLVLFVFLAFSLYLPIPLRTKVLQNHIIFGFGLTLFTLIVSYFSNTFLVNKLITQLGKVSFSMYLIHFAVIEAFIKLGITSSFLKGDFSSVIHYICVLVVTFPISYIFYITIERQSILVGKRLINKYENIPIFLTLKQSHPFKRSN
jgi:peptidoglycan/LPS O-acetylase OafA/YrhL